MMYHKFVDGQEIFSTCRTINLNGCDVCNPSAEQIAEAGWTPYTPPTPPYVPQTEPDEVDLVEALKRMLKTDTDDLTDEEALEVAAAFPTWASRMGEEVAVGERLWYDGDLWKVLLAHTVQENWTPSESPSLFVKVAVVEYPEWAQPVGATDAYALGAKVSHLGKHWVSTIDANVYEPSVYGWEEQV